ncbi:MAG: hypothetical protein IJR72_04855, partial [Oscillospiraceae bacterium]|nr:hypothetical protein [Oscillospiraceae bacterium]
QQFRKFVETVVSDIRCVHITHSVSCGYILTHSIVFVNAFCYLFMPPPAQILYVQCLSLTENSLAQAVKKSMVKTQKTETVRDGCLITKIPGTQLTNAPEMDYNRGQNRKIRVLKAQKYRKQRQKGVSL